jgi:DNA invertase Pin-like site-specific DNA recombinase
MRSRHMGKNAVKGREFAYARVSSKEQNLDRQIDVLSEYVPKENIIVDKASGKDLERANYKALKSSIGLREGDTLYIVSLDRLSRNKQDIKNELQWFKERKIRLKILDLPTSLVEVPEGQEWILDMITNILVEVLSSIAEQERITIRKRQREGIEAAKKKGRYLGRPVIEKPDNYDEVIGQWQAGEITATEAMKKLGIKRNTFYRWLKESQNTDGHR